MKPTFAHSSSGQASQQAVGPDKMRPFSALVSQEKATIRIQIVEE
jgi:hypothetical protein